jgi:hypothetical protein
MQTEHPARRKRLRDLAKGILYLVVLLILLILGLVSVIGFLPLLLAGEELWVRIVFGVVGGFCLLIGFALSLLVNKWIDIRLLPLRFCTVLFWMSWALPLLSVAFALACVIARIAGFEFEMPESGGSHHYSDWDWD